jgi:UDP-N-acetylglucosamine 2-epimerase (non-hydrolysing)
VLVLRDVTERPEAVECGAAQLVGCSEGNVYAAARRLLADETSFRRMAVARFPYGDGTAAKQILAWLEAVPRPRPAEPIGK